MISQLLKKLSKQWIHFNKLEKTITITGIVLFVAIIIFSNLIAQALGLVIGIMFIEAIYHLSLISKNKNTNKTNNLNQNQNLSDTIESQINNDNLAVKQCPFCAETIKLDAKVCRFCQRDLTGGKLQRKGKLKRKKEAIGTIMVIGGFVICIIGVSLESWIIIPGLLLIILGFVVFIIGRFE